MTLVLVAILFVDPDASAQIDVVASAPVDAVGLDRDDIPSNVVTMTRREGTSSTEALIESGASIQFNDVQNNPMQRDIHLRGFVASPLLGLPQGVAVYVDGARMNEAFGDVVNWELIPDAAVEEIDVLPGSHPLFGLNALGGVVSMRTKSGRKSPGVRASLDWSSLNFIRGEATGGFGSGSWDGFLALSAAEDAGWRDFSASRVAQVFAKGGAITSRSTSDVSVAISESTLRGNGPAPVQLLAEDWRAVFTHPDATENEAAAVTGRAQWQLGRETVAALNVHVRRVLTDRFNGDDSPFEPCFADSSILCEEAGMAF